MIVLGISGLYHNSAAALCLNGEILSAAEEERFTRIKNDKSLPVNAIKYCLDSNNITIDDIDIVVYYDNPLLTLDRFLNNGLWIKEKEKFLEAGFQSLFGDKMWIHKRIKDAIGGLGKNGNLHVTQHHLSHAAHTYFFSPYDHAAILILDGVGEWATVTMAEGKGNKINIIRQMNYPHSIGLFYSAFTYYCGFKVNSGEYKMMGLAPYGTPKYVDLIKKELISIEQDGFFQLNMKYFDFLNGYSMINKSFEELFGVEKRQSEGAINQFYCDIACSAQKVTEEIVLLMAKYLKEKTGLDNLCLGGGVALNCVANGLIRKNSGFQNVFIPPGSGDSGGAIGAALYTYYSLNNAERCLTRNNSLVYLGPCYDEIKTTDMLCRMGAVFEEIEEKKLPDIIAAELAVGKIIGIFSGRMEFGPRALGNRSIIANPMEADAQYNLNMKIKYRESFRPFAPAVLEEYVSEYFEDTMKSPYMLFTTKLKENQRIFCEEVPFDDRIRQKRSSVPAITHVDYSARLQTVSFSDNPFFYKIIDAFREKTGCPMVVNTSFNVRGEPIVCSPEDAYRCFMATEMDILLVDRFLLYKNKQPKQNQIKRSYEDD